MNNSERKQHLQVLISDVEKSQAEKHSREDGAALFKLKDALTWFERKDKLINAGRYTETAKEEAPAAAETPEEPIIADDNTEDDQGNKIAEGTEITEGDPEGGVQGDPEGSSETGVEEQPAAEGEIPQPGETESQGDSEEASHPMDEAPETDSPEE